MGNEWKEIKLGELVKPKGGKRLPKGTSLQTAPNKHPYIRVRDMGGRDLPRMGLEFVPDSVFPSIKRYIVEKNDVIISIVGTVGLVSIIDDFYHLASQTENCAKLSGFDSEDAQYIYYYLISNFGQEEIRRNTVGAVQPKLPLYGIEDISIFWPEKIHRLAIGNYFFSIDNKIQLNRQTNQTLEAMAQALFKSWFVDFDPVFDNIIAHNLAHNNAPLHNIPEPLLPHAQRRLNVHNVGRGSARQTAAHAFHHLFPQAFEQSDEPSVGIQGWIPKGWGVSRLDSILELAYGRALKKTERLEGDIPVYGSGGMTGYHNDFLVPGPGIIVGRKGTVGSLYWEDKNFYPIDTVFYVKPMKQYSLEYCFMQLKVLGLENMNTDAAVPGLNRNNAYRLEIVKPEQKIIDKFSDIIKSFQCRKQALQSETENLESLRDTLLPKLISGELRIPDAEQATEALAK